MKNSAINYQNANRENVNAKRRGCSRVETFFRLARQGPDCFCVVCNRCFYPRSLT